MNLSPGVTINPGDAVTRQTVYNLVANATGGTVQGSDLAANVLTVVASPSEPAAYPGKLWYDQTDQVMKVYVDVLDGTGVSLWCAIGPDRFEVPVLATEPIPFGAAVQLAGTGGRKVKLPPDPVSLRAMAVPDSIWEPWKVIGFNNNGPAADHTTTASGAWFSCAIDGYVWVWRPVDRGATWLSSSGNADCFDSLISQLSGLTGPSGYSEVRGGLVWSDYTAQQAKVAGVGLVLSQQRTSAWNGQFWSRSPFFGARTGRQ